MVGLAVSDINKTISKLLRVAILFSNKMSALKKSVIHGVATRYRVFAGEWYS